MATNHDRNENVRSFLKTFHGTQEMPRSFINVSEALDILRSYPGKRSVFDDMNIKSYPVKFRLAIERRLPRSEGPRLRNSVHCLHSEATSSIRFARPLRAQRFPEEAPGEHKLKLKLKLM